ncbi:MAG TPA: phosphoenolpyruvate--protein phosphotransferase [Lentisphaeria bacterium]|nr:MAG: phosphoenolpyruvate--protein phosphotransferase [Lentisphaerae bacterium GWF2_50_93]HCE44959.1 phosphoenolpyruvate--protein phosphotransferase [Lentisphaeria bacterium]
MASQANESIFHGIPASPGIAIGSALVLARNEFSLEQKKIQSTEVDNEIARFREALGKTRIQIQELQLKIQKILSEKDAKIFDAHLLILEDKTLMDEIEDTVKKDKLNIDYVFSKTIERYIVAISSIEDKYFRERASDIKDVAERVLKNLHGREDVFLDHLPGERVIIAHDLTPSDTAGLDRENVLAFATESGSRTSHTAIMARSMQIPAVVGTRNILTLIKSGDLIIIDGHAGNIIVNPTQETLATYAEKETREQKFYEEMLKENNLRPETLDGFRVQLAANMDKAEEISNAKLYGAAGVGLFRTEYLLINSTGIPSEEEQFSVYSSLASALEGQPVIIRTFDVGGDKLSDVITPHHEANPFLGCRAVRLFREHEEIIANQIRAILRASAFGKVKMMFPMITTAEEIDEFQKIIQKVKEELTLGKIAFDERIEVGIMIEIPSAAIQADHLARKVDFFSIGSNDLVQYAMAVDRTNEKVAYLYQPANPAILKLIKNVVIAARRHKIWVSICGEMAGDPRYTPILLGMGIHELSMTPASIGPVRRLVRSLKMHDAQKLVEKSLSANSAKEVIQMSEELISRVAPDIINLAGTGD